MLSNPVMANMKSSTQSCVYLFFCFGMFSYFQNSLASIFTSTEQLKSTIILEQYLLEELSQYVNSMPGGQAEHAKEFLNKTQKLNQLATDELHYMENPLNVYHHIYRMVVSWGAVINTVEREFFDEAAIVFNNAVSQLKQTYTWPDETDMKGVSLGVIRLIKVYELVVQDLADGKILQTKTAPLSCDEVYRLARDAYEGEDFKIAFLWLDTLGEKKKQCTGDYTKLNADLKHYQVAATTMQKKEDPLRKEFHKLCKSSRKKPKELSRLKCYMLKTQVPYRPRKVEDFNLSPKVSLVYDVVNEAEMQMLIRLAKTKLHRSYLADNTFDNERVSQTAWITDFEDPAVEILSKRVEEITGLSTLLMHYGSHAENFQILNYGIGGHYNIHYDFSPYKPVSWRAPYLTESGDRTLTFMLYLSDVIAGGATVFAEAQARVPVTKGAAVMWHNVLRNGQQDPRTLHGGCPVLLGSKWVANKWIHEVGQIFRRPCSLSPYD